MPRTISLRQGIRKTEIAARLGAIAKIFDGTGVAMTLPRIKSGHDPSPGAQGMSCPYAQHERPPDDHKKGERAKPVGRYSAEATWLKSNISPSSPTLPQMAVAGFLESGGYEQHLRRIRREYARNVELLSEAVLRYFPADVRLTRPAGGLVLWVGLPESVDSLELYKMARGRGITLAPGYVFSPTQQFPNFIRLNAAEFNYKTERAMESLGEMIRQRAESRP